ncbi:MULTISPECIES: HNH endonuclease signature motif containing protein [Enterobacterales]|jgi:putative restriction endonuclease|uniref:HNH endonuclease signature motif containing protein n=1 Tax=Enterobacterales TaxID=91347 RepID=UPI00027123CB|nr:MULTISPECIES: HNH endonuclease signature motif containing protein [Enterobacterales]KAJ9430482.1 HNH endonuclease signature motif containing protein [Pantoea sp. YR343]MBB3307145.1 putative restriction endonuclease [Enterobacter sp. Sphag1F]NYI15531.1 putative restriction endonuclease [Enterobacter sp. Sphag71]
MTRRYTPEQADRMRKRRYWFYVDGERFSSAGAANKHVGERIFHAAWRANLIANSGGESMQIGDRTLPVQRGKYTVVLERRKDLSDKSVSDYAAARKKLQSAGWTDDELDEMDDGEIWLEYKSELEREKLDVPHYSGHKKYTRAEVRQVQGRFRCAVLTNWENQCAISGTRLALEAAHIISYASGGSSRVENGVCLAADLHKLLDKGHMQIETGWVRLSDEAKTDPRYAHLEGKPLRKPLIKVTF